MSSDPSINNPRYIPPSEEHLRKKKIRIRRAIVGIGLALAVLTFLETWILKQESNGPQLANNLAVLSVFNIILILIFVLLLLITRNLVKLYNERKSRILGSRFQTKLIIAFLILALFPTIFLFLVANKLFSFSVGNWFSVKVQEPLEQSMEVAREYYTHMEKQALHNSRMIEKFITKNKLYLVENRSQLDDMVSEKIEEYALGGVVIYDNQGKHVASIFHETLPPEYVSMDLSELVTPLSAERESSEVRSAMKEDFLVTAVPLTQKLDGELSVWGYIVTMSHIPKTALQKIESIRKYYEEYKQQSLLKWPVSANYYITFLLVTLLILFSAIWLGFYMARGITVPIQELAEGTRRIAEGDLEFKIGVQANDEIGVLVDSFNKMTNDLNENNSKIQEANEALKSTNIELDRRRRYIETVLENIGAGVVSVDKKGRISTFNKAARRILDVKDQDVLGSSYKYIFSETFQSPIRKMIKQMIRDGSDFLEEQIAFPVGDSQLTLLVNINALQDSNRKYAGMVIVFENLTQMIKAQKVAAWQEVAQGIAHEIKNPLTPIQLNAQRLLKKYYEDKTDFARVFDGSMKVIMQEVEGMKELLNEFVRFSRMPAPNPRPVSLRQILDDVAMLYSDNEKNITVKKNYDPNVNRINVDEEQIRRVFINLFNNALDAMEPGGQIEISTRLINKTNSVQIEFCDDGMGISSSDRDKLFLPHFTTKNRGTGLGLAIVHRVIVDHGGSIQVRDNLPKGTAFIIDLPQTFKSSESAKIISPKQFRKTSPPV